MIESLRAKVDEALNSYLLTNATAQVNLMHNAVKFNVLTKEKIFVFNSILITAERTCVNVSKRQLRRGVNNTPR